MSFQDLAWVGIAGGAGFLLWRTHQVDRQRGSIHPARFHREGLPRDLSRITKIVKDPRRPNRWTVWWANGRRSKMWSKNPNQLLNRNDIIIA